jgi:hypothetical protein
MLNLTFGGSNLGFPIVTKPIGKNVCVIFYIDFVRGTPFQKAFRHINKNNYHENYFIPASEIFI